MTPTTLTLTVSGSTSLTSLLEDTSSRSGNYRSLLALINFVFVEMSCVSHEYKPGFVLYIPYYLPEELTCCVLLSGDSKSQAAGSRVQL